MTDSIFTTTSSSHSAAEGDSLLVEILRLLLTLLFPPLGVALKVGLSLQFFINLLLTVLGYVPGLVHGIWLLAQQSSHRLKV